MSVNLLCLIKTIQVNKLMHSILIMIALFCSQAPFASDILSKEDYHAILKKMDSINENNKVVVLKEVHAILNDLLPIDVNLTAFESLMLHLHSVSINNTSAAYIALECEPLLSQLREKIMIMRGSDEQLPKDILPKLKNTTSNEQSKRNNTKQMNNHSVNDMLKYIDSAENSSDQITRILETKIVGETLISGENVVVFEKLLQMVSKNPATKDIFEEILQEKLDLCHSVGQMPLEKSVVMSFFPAQVALQSHSEKGPNNESRIHNIQNLNACAKIVKEKAPSMKIEEVPLYVSETMIIFLGFFNIYPDDISEKVSHFVQRNINEYLKLHPSSHKLNSLELANTFYIFHIIGENGKDKFFDTLYTDIMAHDASSNISHYSETTGITRAMLATTRYQENCSSGVDIPKRFQIGVDSRVNGLIKSKIHIIKEKISYFKQVFSTHLDSTTQPSELLVGSYRLQSQQSPSSSDRPFNALERFIDKLPKLNEPDIENPCSKEAAGDQDATAHPYKSIHPVVFYDLLCNVYNCISQAYDRGPYELFDYHEEISNLLLKGSLTRPNASQAISFHRGLNFDEPIQTAFDLLLKHKYGEWSFVAYFLGNSDIVSLKFSSKNDEVEQKSSQNNHKSILKIIDHYVVRNNAKRINEYAQSFLDYRLLDELKKESEGLRSLFLTLIFD